MFDAPKELVLAPCGAPDGHWAEAEVGTPGNEVVRYIRADIPKAMFDALESIRKTRTIFCPDTCHGPVNDAIAQYNEAAK